MIEENPCLRIKAVVMEVHIISIPIISFIMVVEAGSILDMVVVVVEVGGECILTLVKVINVCTDASNVVFTVFIPANKCGG